MSKRNTVNAIHMKTLFDMTCKNNRNTIKQETASFGTKWH